MLDLSLFCFLFVCLFVLRNRAKQWSWVRRYFSLGPNYLGFRILSPRPGDGTLMKEERPRERVLRRIDVARGINWSNSMNVNSRIQDTKKQNCVSYMWYWKLFRQMTGKKTINYRKSRCKRCVWLSHKTHDIALILNAIVCDLWWLPYCFVCGHYTL